jgi:sarcosine oxidase
LRHFDAVVVGCGAMGSAAAYQLASRGLRTLVVERFDLNHTHGSSHGKTRIIRTAYSENPRYVPLVRRALSAWMELQKESGKRIYRMTGGLLVGRREGALVAGALRSARQFRLQHELLSSAQVMDRFGVFRFDENVSAVYERNAGVLFPEEIIESYVTLARNTGAEFRFREPLIRWKSRKDGIELRTEKDSFSADRVVLAMGGWSASFLKRVVTLTCERQVPFWFDAGGNAAFGADRMPVFIVENESGRTFYGIPDVGHGVKVAMHHGGEEVDGPDSVDRRVVKSDKQPVQDFVRRVMPRLSRDPLDWTTCVYTNTADGNFVVDFHPRDSRTIVVSACSGHGFKFASVIGEIAADLATDGRTEHDISLFAIQRFSPQRPR